ncbi:MAG: hypothetical protein CL608_04680 [Anaerolineaceae bacterium]|nr:hypothetical protein [Anaerolineaceae bacterium]
MSVDKPVTEDVIRDFLEKQTEHLEGRIENLKNEVLDFKVEILGEIKSLREEVQVTTNYRDMIASNEKRIEQLEKQIARLRAN